MTSKFLLVLIISILSCSSYAQEEAKAKVEPTDSAIFEVVPENCTGC